MKKEEELKEEISNWDNAINYLNSLPKESLYDKICKLEEKEKKEYNKLFENFKNKNSNNECSTNEKGNALEEIVCFILNCASIFNVKKNFRTNSNELDQLIILNDIGKSFLNQGRIDKRIEQIIGECKNYKNTVSVTYVGKLCSLLMTTNTKIGILFSYKGVSGKRWEDACGLIRKFYLCKENKEERYCIIDFNIKDFERIKNGTNILEIIEDKILSLQYDCEYEELITSHEAEKNFLI